MASVLAGRMHALWLKPHQEMISDLWLQVSPSRVLLRRRSSVTIKVTGHVTFGTGRLRRATTPCTSSVMTRTSRTVPSWLTFCRLPMMFSRRTWEQNLPDFNRISQILNSETWCVEYFLPLRWSVTVQVWSRWAASSTNLLISPSTPTEPAEESWSSTLRSELLCDVQVLRSFTARKRMKSWSVKFNICLC